MKVSELLFEEEKTPDYSEVVKKLVGEKFTWKDQEFTITKVTHHKPYQNYDLNVKPPFSNPIARMVDDDAPDEIKARVKSKDVVHPYGGNNVVVRTLSKMLGGLSVGFSESGMQGNSRLNVDIGPPRLAPPVDVQKGLEQLKDFALSRGWTVDTDWRGKGYSVTRKGKGDLLFTYLPETDEEEGKFSLQRFQSWGWGGVISGALDYILKDMQSGYSKKYFTVPKDPSVEKAKAEKKAEPVDETAYKTNSDYKELSKKFDDTISKSKVEFPLKDGRVLIVMRNGYVRLKPADGDVLRVLGSPIKGGTEDENFAHALDFANKWVKKQEAKGSL